MKTLSERIKEAQAELTRKKDILLDLTQQLEDTPDDDTLLEQVDEQSGQVEKAVKHYESLKRAETALAERLANQEAPAIIHSTGKPEESSELWVKSAVCEFLAHVRRERPETVRQEIYNKNKALETVFQMRTKTAVPLATTFDTGWAAELVQSDTQGFINLLAPNSVTAALASRSMPLNFGGFDSINMPRRSPRTPATSLRGAFVGEGGAIPLGRIGVGSTKLSRFKHAVISTFSRELAERSTPTIETVIRQAILDDMGMSLDEIFLDSNAAVTGVRPAGIANGVTPTSGTAGGGTDAVIADIKAGAAAMAAAGVGVRPVLIINSTDAMSIGLMQTALGEFIFKDDIAGGRLLFADVIASLNVPQGTAFLVDGNAIATAFDAVEFDVNDYATVVEANADDTAPTHADDGAGALGTAGEVPRNAGIAVSDAGGAAAAYVGSTARSLWQTYSVGIRSVQGVSWGIIQPGAVVYYTGLTW